MTLSRRRLLQAAGLGAGSALLPSLWRGAKAGPPTAPARMVICYTQHGVVHESWGMRRGMPDNARWDYALGPLLETEFSRCLRPLWRHRNKLAVVDGLSLATAIGDPYGDAHAKGWCSSLTGAIARETIYGVKSNAAKPSLDQLLGKVLRAQNPFLTDLVTQEFGVYENNFHAAIYGEGVPGGNVRRLPHLEQPKAAFDRMFPNGDGTVPPDPVRVAQPDVLAEVASMYDAVRGRLSTQDRQKLEQHRDLVRDMESRLRTQANTTCVAPPDLENWRYDQVPHAQRYTDHTRSFWDLTRAALTCDMSRVITMQFGPLRVDMIGGTGDLHHDYAHPSGPNHVNDPKHPLAKTVMTNYTAKYASFVAELADQLDDVPEANGTLLDNTMIVMMSELAHGDHAHDRWPLMIIGGGNLIRTGRYYNYEKETPTTTLSTNISAEAKIGLPHNHLLVTLAQAMGWNTDTVGAASIRPKKASAPDIDLRGPLPELLL
ncbi:MAG: DUF1552 domain-containing protein [Deltaproteobacteria bacterium]|nr:DUF1552 domain-containing protein [Deltaproteobacteria bacterium]